MTRILLAVVLAAVLWPADNAAAESSTAGAAPAVSLNSQQPWPLGGADYALDPVKFPRGPGGYLSWFKLLLVWLVFLGWVFSTDWINQDAQRRKLDYLKWNSIAVFGFVAALLLVWVLPWFLASLVLVLAAWIAPLALYVRHRNAGLDTSEQVLTREHLRFLINSRLKKTGVQIKEKAAQPEGPPIELEAVGGATERDDKANTLKARHTPGFRTAGELLVHAITHRAAVVMLDYTRDTVAVRYLVDGVWTDQPRRDRASGDALLEALKTLAGRDPADRLSRQQGSFEAKHEKTRYACRLTSQGVKTGERVMVQIDDGSARKARLESIHMPENLQAALKELVSRAGGLVLVSAPPRGGFSTLLSATVTAVDRFMRSVMAMENQAHLDLQVENVPVKSYDLAAGQKPADVLLDIIRQYPDVFVVPELNDGGIVTTLCNEATEEKRLVIGGVRAAGAAEALHTVATLNPPPKGFLAALSGVVNVRLARRLCPTCKEAYKPAPNLLQQLNLSPDEVEAFYQPPKPAAVQPGKKPPPPCADCGGVGYRGQIPMYELMVVSDALRQALKSSSDVKAIRQLARKAGMRTLQDEGIQLVVAGETSIQELTRVLKKEDAKKDE